jgi:hypothetical protein
MKTLALILVGYFLLFCPRMEAAGPQEPAVHINTANLQLATDAVSGTRSFVQQTLLTTSAAMLGLVLLVIELLRRTPEGYQDRDGFHFARRQSTKARRRVRIWHLRVARKAHAGWSPLWPRQLLSSH